MRMKTNPFLRTVIILAILFLITYALADGIKYGNTLGIVLAMGSMFALGVCIYLAKKLAQIEVEEDEQQ